jgi:hypothetical protein
VAESIGRKRIKASQQIITFIITIMVLDLKVPQDGTFDVLLPLWPVFMSYVLSFIYVKFVGTSSDGGYPNEFLFSLALTSNIVIGRVQYILKTYSNVSNADVI